MNIRTLLMISALGLAGTSAAADYTVTDVTTKGKGCQYANAGGKLRAEASAVANILSIGFSKYGEHVDKHFFEADFVRDRTDPEDTLAVSDCVLTFTVASADKTPFRLTAENFVVDYVWQDPADAFDAHTGMRLTELGHASHTASDFQRIFGPKDGKLSFEFANDNFRTRCRASHRLELAFSFQLGGIIEPGEEINSRVFFEYLSELDTYVEACKK